MSKTNHNLNRYPELLPVLAVVLALAAAAICIPAEEADAADSGSCGDGVVWSFEGDTLSVTYTGEGTGRMDDHSDPMEFGYASLWKSINNVVIGEGVTYLGYCAFNGFAIKSITLSSTVEEIGRSSLAGNDITSVDLKNVVRIGQSAFNENKKLESVVIPSTVESIGNYAFDLCESLANADTSGATSLTSIGNSAFVHNAITSFYVPASVTSLGTGIFAECFNLGTINVDEANENYVSVDGVVYDAGMTAVLHFPAAKECALYEIPDTVTSVGPAAFANSYRMRAVTIPDSVTVIGNNGFEKSTGLTSIKIPATVTSIGNFAFNSCENIKTIDFSGTTVLKSIGDGAFLSCSSIKTVEIPKCVESLGIRAFGHCQSLESITIDPSNPNYKTVDGILYDKNMETLMQFPGGHPATSFTIPSTVKTIDINALSSLTKLESLTIPDSVTTINDGACTCSPYHVTLLKIVFGNGITETGAKPFISHHFFGKDGKELEQTAGNLKGHTFTGEEASHMVIDDGKSGGDFPVWAIAVIAIAVLAAIAGFVFWKRSR